MIFDLVRRHGTKRLVRFTEGVSPDFEQLPALTLPAAASGDDAAAGEL